MMGTMRPTRVLPLACAVLAAAPDAAGAAARLAESQAKAALRAQASWVPVWRARLRFLGTVPNATQLRLVWYEHPGGKGGKRLLVLDKDGRLLAHYSGFRVAPTKLEGTILRFPEDVEEGNVIDFKEASPPLEVWISRAFHRHVTQPHNDPLLRELEQEREHESEREHR